MELKAEVNIDPWGLGYWVVMRKLRLQSTSPIMDGPHIDAIVNALFPIHPVNIHEPRAEDKVPLFSDEELKEAPGILDEECQSPRTGRHSGRSSEGDC